ncbi:unnamed protein product [Caenorhabditis angaria]|uniref:Uncharacterized protein n=1 Tax=Caenorhabditis angaria TaxID=860376 RepID=A0A9P1ISF4_9PELO|nr:unnamed protein product [Caenorhabditis angaria]
MPRGNPKSTFVLQNIKNYAPKKNFEQIRKFADASHTFVRLAEVKSSVCYTDWNVVWRVLNNLRQAGNMDRKVADSEMIKFYSMQEMREKFGAKNFDEEIFIFVKRDPLERAVEEFMKICIEEKHPCFGCGFDFICHLEKVHFHLATVSAKNSTMHWDYVRYIPQNWFCHMANMSNRFFIFDYKELKYPEYDMEYYANQELFGGFGDVKSRVTGTFREYLLLGLSDFQLHFSGD